jgi:hypothetical protein
MGVRSTFRFSIPLSERVVDRMVARRRFLLALPATFLTPLYDITFSASADPWKVDARRILMKASACCLMTAARPSSLAERTTCRSSAT